MHTFYDVKSRAKVTVAVTSKTSYTGKSGTRYAFKGQTADGRNLTGFVNKATWDASTAPVS